MGVQAPAANLAGDSYGHPVVSRKVGERIIIAGGLLVIEVAQVRGNRVRLRVSAPRELRIDREEVHNARIRMGGMVDEVLRAADEATNRKADQ